ncbi:hypothetical protein E1B28_000919 [Marasmius oreades]|uniref:Homeobox domain-containing protein n=1 Tax=Marasmius oreades TaxID=181124 RepID=A0A9P7V2C7_9AGAR|nr:uncharacterized protein E1B28_000919 [Marasmius oreades]KAG7099039.1 hypothetical protein E1B28_000919 [Marasmius oreades]
MSSFSLSPSPPLSSISANDPLQFLAGIAIGSNSISNPKRTSTSPSPTRCSKRLSQRKTAITYGHLSGSPRPLSSASSSFDDSVGRDSSLSCPNNTKTPRKACHKSSKPTSLQKCAKAAIQPHRQEIMNRALRIKTVENSPANPRQLRVLRMVYDEITNYPKEHWMALIAIVIHRSFNQVKHWFSNERQKNKGGDFVNWKTNLGENIRVRPMAVELSSEWSDELFEAALMIFHFRLMKLLRWEEENDSLSHTSH